MVGRRALGAPLLLHPLSLWVLVTAAGSAPRRVYDTRTDERVAGVQGDCDDDKYRRRPALGWLAQLLRYVACWVDSGSWGEW